MCGLLGYISNNEYSFKVENFNNNLSLLERRGPDYKDFFQYNSENYNLYLGHTRLSIIELSNIANQPFKDASNVLIFNGEIYNHLKLRNNFYNKDLFKSKSDTETLFNLLKYNKIEKVLQSLEGMFAFCFFDKVKNKLYLARDRAGEKPLYLYINKMFFGFSSDLSVFKKNITCNLTINSNSIRDFMNLQYIPSPNTIYSECFKIPNGSFIEIDLNKYRFEKTNSFEEFINKEGVFYKKWWKLKFNSNIYTNDNYIDIRSNTEKLIQNAVKKQLLSDVPLGAFLSSGIDSSLIVSMMQMLSGNTQTFTIGYQSKSLNESVEAKQISQHLNTNHHEFIFDSKDLINLVEKVPYAYSEPFADSSQIPTLMISKLASEKVKVILSGDGGDEIFGGYNRYIIANRYWKFFKYLPYTLRKQILSLIYLAPKKSLNFLLNKFTSSNNIYKIIDKLKKIKSEKDYYYSMINEWNNVSDILNTSNNYQNKNTKIFDAKIPFEKKMMMEDFNTYLPDDILCKVDRASMYYSLETRAPFLDHNILEYCFSINNKFIFNKNNGKYILKDILGKYLPQNLISNKKKGFAVPISEWLNNELLDWSNDYLTKEMCDKHRFFNYDTILKIKKNRNKSVSSDFNKIWTIVQFNKWYSEIYK